MGLFNLVRPKTKTVCPRCGVEDYWWIQFKYASSTMARYEIGSTVEWGVPGYPEIGTLGLPHVFTEGISQGCEHCGYAPEDDEYSDIELRKDEIVDVTC
ncbi:hypothetical protein [Sphaerisporangium album]|uniref:hypothetical protein n=1 Tax=Sphaerisporangium album TaxID=509200 RepID=UPI0011C02666|nr:hypothetical protein [Sphaerisporangium album]